MSSKDFWRTFRQKHWEKKALVHESSANLCGIFFDPGQVFEALLRFTEHMRSSGSREFPIRAFVDGQFLPPGPELVQVLPTKEDGSFEGYNRRIADRKTRYGIVINHFQSFDSSLWETYCRQAQPFYQQIGFSRCASEMVLFLGNYERTPFGVHEDPGSIFHFPIVGQKSIRAWSKDYADRHPDLKKSQNYHKHLSQSQLLNVKAGGLIYWPSHMWHIGESDGSFSVSLGMPFYLGAMNRNHRPYMQNYLKKNLDDKLFLHPSGLRLKPENPKQTMDDSIRILEEEFEAYRQIINSPECRREFRRHAVELASAYGFSFTPEAPRTTRLSMDDVIRTDSTFPVFYAEDSTHKNTFFVACKGRSFEVKNTPFLPALIHTLNEGTAHRVADLVRKFSLRGRGASEVLKILRSLQGLGGVELVTHKNIVIIETAA